MFLLERSEGILMNSVSSNIQNVNQQNKPVSKKQKAAGLATGFGVGVVPLSYIAYDTFRTVKDTDIPVMQQFMDSVIPNVDYFDNVKKITNEIIKNEGLADKGVKLFVTDGSKESIAEFDKMFGKVKPKKYIENVKKTLMNGGNAAYVDKYKKVMLNDKHGYGSFLHELGHAKNFNSNNILVKALKHARKLTPFGISVVAPIALAVGLIHHVNEKKPKEEKGKVEKTLDFITDNAGKITLASYAPMVIEEGLASINGLKMGKKYLDPKMLNKLKSSYLKAWGTYALTASVVAATVGLGITLKENIFDNKKRA